MRPDGCPKAPQCVQKAPCPVVLATPRWLLTDGDFYQASSRMPEGATERPDGRPKAPQCVLTAAQRRHSASRRLTDRWHHLSGDQTSNQNTPQCVSTVNLPETPQCVLTAKLAPQSVQIAQFLTPSHFISNNLLTLFYRDYIYIHTHTIYMYIV